MHRDPARGVLSEEIRSVSKTRLVLFGPLIVLVTAWACAAIWIDGPSSRPLAGILALVFAAGMLAAFVLLRRTNYRGEDVKVYRLPRAANPLGD